MLLQQFYNPPNFFLEIQGFVKSTPPDPCRNKWKRLRQKNNSGQKTLLQAASLLATGVIRKGQWLTVLWGFCSTWGQERHTE